MIVVVNSFRYKSMNSILSPYQNTMDSLIFFVIFNEDSEHKFFEVSDYKLIETLDDYFKNGEIRWTGNFGRIIPTENEESLLTIQAFDNENVKTICDIKESGYIYISNREYKIKNIDVKELFQDIRNIANTGYLYTSTN